LAIADQRLVGQGFQQAMCIVVALHIVQQLQRIGLSGRQSGRLPGATFNQFAQLQEKVQPGPLRFDAGDQPQLLQRRANVAAVPIFERAADVEAWLLGRLVDRAVEQFQPLRDACCFRQFLQADLSQQVVRPLLGGRIIGQRRQHVGSECVSRSQVSTLKSQFGLSQPFCGPKLHRLGCFLMTLIAFLCGHPLLSSVSLSSLSPNRIYYTGLVPIP
jgi:hypothetical protein